MATSRAKNDVAVAVLAKAPVAGFAKTRLIPALGEDGAARLQAHLTEHAIETAVEAKVGPVTLWVAPDASHSSFQMLAKKFAVALERQPDGDLGVRMLAAIAAANGPALVIGTDCPALTPAHLREAAETLRAGHDAVFVPVEDGGYALIGLREADAALFSGMTWSTATVMEVTRARLRQHDRTWRELPTLWDIDRPEDLPRLAEIGLGHLLPPAR